MASVTPRRARVANRRAAAIQMRIEGHSYEDITEQLGYISVQSATKDVHRALERSVVDLGRNVEILREVESRRMDQMLLALQPGIARGNARSIEVAVKIMERRAKMLGLDSATKVEVLTIDAIDAQIAELSAQLASAGVPSATPVEG